MNKPEHPSHRDRAARRRAALRARGLRPRENWVPDLRDPKVQAEICEGCRRINQVMAESDDMAFIEAVQYWPEEDPD